MYKSVPTAASKLSQFPCVSYGVQLHISPCHLSVLFRVLVLYLSCLISVESSVFSKLVAKRCCIKVDITLCFF